MTSASPASGADSPITRLFPSRRQAVNRVTGRAGSSGAKAGGGNRRPGLAVLVIAAARLRVVFDATIVQAAFPTWSLVTPPARP